MDSNDLDNAAMLDNAESNDLADAAMLVNAESNYLDDAAIPEVLDNADLLSRMVPNVVADDYSISGDELVEGRSRKRKRTEALDDLAIDD